MEKKNVILEKSFEFALAIIEFSEELDNEKKFVIARQLLKSGTLKILSSFISSSKLSNH